MLPSCSFIFPSALLFQVCTGLLSLSFLLCIVGSTPWAAVLALWGADGAAGACHAWLVCPGFPASKAGLAWAPTHQRSRVTSQGAFVGVTASDKKVLVLFEQLVWMQTAEMGEGSFWPCLLERLNLQRMCWVLTPLGPCECSVLFWTPAFSIRVKYIICYYHTVKLIFTILCMIYLRFHWTKQASGIEVL